jgi:type II secretory pathway component PulJ
MMLRTPYRSVSREAGFTLVEVLVATVVGMVLVLAAFALLEFSTRDVSRITDRAHADQTGRVALENIMLALHSSCVAVGINPVQLGSNGSELKFISEQSPLNAGKEPVSAIPSAQLRKLIFSKSKSTLTEQTWTGKWELTKSQYVFNEAEKPTERVLLNGISQTGEQPIFQYYRYYNEHDTEPKYGQIDPTAFVPKGPEEAETITKVTAAFTLTPEGTESSFAKGDRAVALEDSAILRLTPSSEGSNISNQPCTQRLG